MLIADISTYCFHYSDNFKLNEDVQNFKDVQKFKQFFKMFRNLNNLILFSDQE